MKILLTQNDLEQLYLRDKMSIRAIAKHTGYSPSGIKRKLHQFSIPMRNKCESLNLCPDAFTQQEEELIIGTCLGDGHLTVQRGPNGESQLYLGHSTKQRSYIEWKYNLLHRFIGCKIYSLWHTLDNGKKYETLNFLTRKSKLFTSLRKRFYSDRTKVVPFDLLQNLTPFSLAVWYMDDGYNYRTKGCEFMTQSFSKDENTQILGFFRNNLGCDGSLRHKGKKKYSIYIFKEHKQKLFDVMEKFIIPSMYYKLESSEAIRQTPKGEEMVRSIGKPIEV